MLMMIYGDDLSFQRVLNGIYKHAAINDKSVFFGLNILGVGINWVLKFNKR